MSRTDEAYAELIRRVKDYNLLASCGALLGWDERTYMPHEGSAHRAEQMALVARLTHEMATAPRLGELLAEVEGGALGEDAAANVREIRRSYDRAVKLPPDLVETIVATEVVALHPNK